MSSKAARKPLKVDEADLVPAPKPALPATPDIDDARILASADALSAKHGALRDGSTSVAALKAAPPQTPRASWKIVLPDYLDTAIGRAAIEARTSKNAILIHALKTAGFEVRDEDLVGDRRRRNRN